MQLFEHPLVQEATTLTHFMEFLTTIAPLYGQTIPFEDLRECPWREYQQSLADFIITGLANLTILPPQEYWPDHVKQSPALALPHVIKGVYFCLADDALHFSIHGSLYYNEAEWATNADYDYAGADSDVFEQLSESFRSRGLDSDMAQDVRYLFAVFTLLQTLRGITNIPAIANAGIALGYCDGDILVLGRFVAQHFMEQLEWIENGDYEKPSTQPAVIDEPLAPRGALWCYLRQYCRSFIETNGLTERFRQFGEAEAQRISEVFKCQLCLNQCPSCGAIKKTPRARLCLTCGEFTPPVGH